MIKLRKAIEKAMIGHKVNSIKLSLLDIRELQDIYNKLARKEKANFINGNCYKILLYCGLKVKTEGIGWNVAK